MFSKMNGNVKTFFSYPSFPSSPTAGGVIGLITTRRRSGPSHRALSPDSDVARMLGSQNGGCLEEFLIIFGLVAVQVINALYVVMLTPILSSGFKPMFLITFACTATCIFVLPFAIAFESKKWPSRLSSKLIAQIVLISLTGVTTFQILMLFGIEKTSPAIATAMPNLAPGIIFIIAACLRFEKVDLKCKYTKAKILGTIICLGGAIMMSLLQSPPNILKSQYQNSFASLEALEVKVYKDWAIGCLYLLAAVIVVSCCTVLQAATMVNFPAPFTLCSVTSLFGAIFTVFIQIATEGTVNPGSTMINLGSIIAIMILGGMMIAMCVSFQTWAVKKKGPVLVSMFSPIQTVCSIIFSAVFLDQIIKIGSLAGMFVMFSGLYIVLWAKKKEGFISDDMIQQSDDVEKPLLS